MTNVLLDHKPDLEARDGDYNSTPLQWALHGAQAGWYQKTGDFAGVIKTLLLAGSPVPDDWTPS